MLDDVSAIAFESCKPEVPRSGNVLLSPSMQLSTDTLLTFQLRLPSRSSLAVYVTSEVGHVLARIGAFAGNGPGLFTMESMCVPRSSSQIAFAASPYLESDLIAIKHVVLTGTPCTPRKLSGNELAVCLHAQSDSVHLRHSCELCRSSKKWNGFSYTLPSVRPGADPGVQAVSQPANDLSHRSPGVRLPLLSARPAVTFPAAEHHRPLAGTHLPSHGG